MAATPHQDRIGPGSSCPAEDGLDPNSESPSALLSRRGLGQLARLADREANIMNLDNAASRYRLTPLTIGALALLGASSSAQAKAQPPAQDEHRRIYDDPAEFEKVSGAMQNLLIAKFGPRVVLDAKGNPVAPAIQDFSVAPQGGGILSVLGNVLVNNAAADGTAQDTQSETALVLGSGSNLISAFNDSGSFIGANHFTGWAHSSDSGSSWTDPGVLPGNNDAGDPVLARDTTTGRVYLATLYFSGSGINIHRSDDDGVTWLPAVNGAPQSGSMDKEWLAVDNFPGSGNGNVYLVVRDFGSGNGIYFFRSTDQGATFGNVALIASGSPSNVQGAYIVVTPDHVLHAFWYDSNPSPDEIRTRSSSDQGLTWGAPVTVTQLTSTATNGNLSLTAGFRSNSFPQVAVNPVSGAMYLVYNDPVAASGGDRGNVLLRQSTDGGSTWTAPTLVNDDGGTKAQYFPTIACRPDGSGLAVCWYDNRNDPGDALIERWGVTASISGSVLTFGPNFRISPQFPPVFGVDPVINSVYMGDYDQMVADNSFYYTTWGDNRDDSIAVPGRKNANVRFVSFDETGPGALVGFDSFEVVGGNGNGRIDPNECLDVFVSLQNDGTAPATGITATLSSLTPGVTILDAFQAFPDLPPTGSVQNLVPFQVSTSFDLDCQAPIEFTLDVTHSAGAGPLGFATASNSEYLVTAGSGTIVPGTTDIGNHTDDGVTSIALPFSVNLYSGSYNSVTLSSNGTAQFTSGSTAYSNACLPTSTFGDTILPHWDDLRTDTAGSGIFTSTSGVAPNRTFHIEWRATYYSGGAALQFELRLHENSSSFEIVYGPSGNAGISATAGCQRGSGGGSTEYSCNQSLLTNGLMLSFELPGCPDGGGSCGGSPTPSITSVLPDHGPTTGATGIVITGNHFTGATSVNFGGESATFTVDSDQQITADLGPSATTGYVNVSVTAAGGTGTLVDGYDFFVPPVDVGSPCAAPFLTWSGAPTLGEKYRVSTQNLGGASQAMLISWSNVAGGTQRVRAVPASPCLRLLFPTEIVPMGTRADYSVNVPLDPMLIGVHLRTQAQILTNPVVTTQMLDATIGE
jgi:hypothetical protein